MKKLRDLTWDDVFAIWTANEADNPGWIKTATEIKGWPDWKSWRMFSANQLKLPERSWQLFEFEKPIDEIPAMYVGPWTGWQSRLPQPNKYTFADLVKIPEQHQHFNQVPDIQRMIQSFPSGTVMTALQKPDGTLALVEGHHRATAVAIARNDGKQMVFNNPVHVAVAKLGESESGLLDAVLARGSTKELPL